MIVATSIGGTRLARIEILVNQDLGAEERMSIHTKYFYLYRRSTTRPRRETVDPAIWSGRVAIPVSELVRSVTVGQSNCRYEK
jgi:hypothetical protein